MLLWWQGNLQLSLRFALVYPAYVQYLEVLFTYFASSHYATLYTLTDILYLLRLVLELTSDALRAMKKI